MATSKNETALKARQTKLNKKSKEELINIVLKKDKIEKVLNRQVSKLKGENCNSEQLMKTKDIKINKLAADNSHLNLLLKQYNTVIERNKTEIESYKTEIESYKNDVKRLNKESNIIYNVIVGLTILFIISIVMHLVR